MSWTFLTNHALILLAMRDDPAARIADLAAQAHVTKRTCHRVINDLVADGYATRLLAGGHRVYTVNEHVSLRHPANPHLELSVLLDLNIPPARREALQPRPPAQSHKEQRP